MKLTRLGMSVLAAAAFASAAPAQEPPPAAVPQAVVVPPKTYYEAVEVMVTGRAEAAGVVVVVLQGVGGEPKSANVNVLAKTTESDIARDVAKELTVLSGSAYKVKTKSGNRIVITKAAKTSPNLSVALGMQTVPGVAVSFGKD